MYVKFNLSNDILQREMVESPSKPESVHDLTRVEDQLIVDDDALTAKLPGRKSNRNRVIHDTSTKASLPERQSSRNRTVFKKAESYHNFPSRTSSISCASDKIHEQPAELRRIKTVK